LSIDSQFDTIVVGAGAAGCVLASRLSEDANHSVLLIEAGPDYGPDPAGWPPELLDPSSIWPDSHSWGYIQASRDSGTPVPLPRTRIVGGTTTVNGCVWLRGSAADYDEWRDLGNPGWGFADLLPYFQRAESDPEGGPLAGRDGPVPVFREPMADLTAVDRAFIAAAESIGIPFATDLNAPPEQQPGVGSVPKNIADGIRMNGAFTYLTPARSRPNLTIRANTTIDRVLVERGRATGVRATDGTIVEADRVLLSAGTYGSPAILLRSGIGPARQLSDIGIVVHADLPGVGENLQEHPLVAPDRQAPRLIQAQHSPPSRSFAPVIAKAQSRHAGNDIDLHIYMGQNYDEIAGAWFFWISASLQHARSLGRLRLTSANPDASLTIDHAFFSDPQDLDALCDGVELIERITAAAPMRDVLKPVMETQPPWGQPADLPRWIRQRFATTYHPTSTCRMGPATDPMAVVNHRGRVHDIEGLRVIDASIFPTCPRANVHFTIVAAAEKLAADIRESSAP
jgi:choline dehydrogenase